MQNTQVKIGSLKNFREGEKSAFSVYGVLKSAQVRPTKSGGEFIVAEFSDNTGSFNPMFFSDSPCYDEIKGARTGDVYRIFGTTGFYQGKFSPRIEALQKLEDSETAAIVSELAEVSPYDVDGLKKEFGEFIESISFEPLKNTVRQALSEAGADFFTSTAAVKMHHAYVHGLLEHTVKLSRLIEKLAPLYPYVNRDLAMAGVILHDIGKVIEYSQGLAVERTRAGILQGHVVLGYRIVRKAALKSKLNPDLTERLEHIILSHQGELEWGAAALAATPEAVLVSLADNLDAKMGAVEYALNHSEGEFSDFVGALKTKLLTSKPSLEIPETSE